MKDNKTKKMGRTPDISQIEIIEAGKKLIEANNKVSGYALRKAVGRKGDPIRMIRIWDEYQNSLDNTVERAIELTPAVKMVLTDSINSISTTFETLFVDIYKKAKSDAQGLISSAINLAEVRQIKADKEMQDAMITIEELEQELSTLEESLEVNECAAEKLLKTTTELETALEQLTQKGKEQYKLLELATSAKEEVIKNTALKEAHIETLTQNNTDLKADKTSLQKEVEQLKIELLNKTKEHDQHIKNTLKKLENKFDSAA